MYYSQGTPVEAVQSMHSQSTSSADAAQLTESGQRNLFYDKQWGHLTKVTSPKIWQRPKASRSSTLNLHFPRKWFWPRLGTRLTMETYKPSSGLLFEGTTWRALSTKSLYDSWIQRAWAPNTPDGLKSSLDTTSKLTTAKAKLMELLMPCHVFLRIVRLIVLIDPLQPFQASAFLAWLLRVLHSTFLSELSSILVTIDRLTKMIHYEPGHPCAIS